MAAQVVGVEIFETNSELKLYKSYINFLIPKSLDDDIMIESQFLYSKLLD